MTKNDNKTKKQANNTNEFYTGKTIPARHEYQ